MILLLFSHIRVAMCRFSLKIHQVDRRGAAETLLTSVVGAFTCLGAFAVVMVDINYIAGCCSLLEDNCEVGQRTGIVVF